MLFPGKQTEEGELMPGGTTRPRSLTAPVSVQRDG